MEKINTCMNLCVNMLLVRIHMQLYAVACYWQVARNVTRITRVEVLIRS